MCKPLEDIQNSSGTREESDRVAYLVHFYFALITQDLEAYNVMCQRHLTGVRIDRSQIRTLMFADDVYSDYMVNRYHFKPRASCFEVTSDTYSSSIEVYSPNTECSYSYESHSNTIANNIKNQENRASPSSSTTTIVHSIS